MSRQRVIVAAVLVVGALFVGHAGPWISRGFGYSLDGFNGAVWGQGARAAVDDPIASRLGGIQPDGHRYANHPPLTVWSGAVLSAVSGDSPVAVRLPAVLASLLALAALALLLHDAGAAPGAVVVGIVAAGTCSMFLTYGAMLDTPVVSLPFALLTLVAAQRGWQGRPPPTWITVGAAALACLSGWQAALLTGIAVAVSLVAHRRTAARLLIGMGLGTAVSVAWIGWVHGSLRPLLDQASYRTSTGGTQVSWLTAQQRHVGDLYGPVLLVLVAVGLAVALLPRPDAPPTEPSSPPWARPLLTGMRPLVLVLAASVAGYTALFRNGSAIHDYWTFWGVALVAVGVAALADRLVGVAEGRALPTTLVTAVTAVVVVALAGSGLTRHSDAEQRVRDGVDLIAVIEEAPNAPDPTAAAIAVYDQPGTLPWADYAVDGLAVHADDVDELRALPPDLPVLVVLGGPASPALKSRAIAVNDRFALVPAAALADHLSR
ncbi:MAG TPA: glycosyltransferase family 39 protein [Iamia sp.]|nr:glycosyltransferase family 39 protein [Iamia sp.]